MGDIMSKAKETDEATEGGAFAGTGFNRNDGLRQRRPQEKKCTALSHVFAADYFTGRRQVVGGAARSSDRNRKYTQQRN